MRYWWAACVSCVVLACSSYRDQLNRGQHYYDESQFEDALALLRSLEQDMDSLSWTERARYAYFRGMTDYRLGYRGHARYWLGISQAIVEMQPGSLAVEWEERAKETLTDLNKDVYGSGEFGDAAARAPGAEPAVTAGVGGAGAVAVGAAGAEPGPRACKHDVDCSDAEVCLGNACVTP